MSKEYTYLEAIREIFIDKSKRFTDNKTGEIMFFNKGLDLLNIKLDSANIMEELIINDNWIKSKWTLVEEKKKYNVRVYGVYNNKLLSSENVTMTEVEIDDYKEELFNKGKVEVEIKGEEVVFFKNIRCEHKIVVEEIVTT